MAPGAQPEAGRFVGNDRRYVHQGQHVPGLGGAILLYDLLDEPKGSRVLNQGTDLRAVQT
jgi:hypothetical protein